MYIYIQLTLMYGVASKSCIPNSNASSSCSLLKYRLGGYLIFKHTHIKLSQTCPSSMIMHVNVDVSEKRCDNTWVWVKIE